MRTITETWEAGQTRVYPIAGGRFEILASYFPVDVSFQSASGVELTNGRAQNIGAGSYKNSSFGRVAITSEQAQPITFLIADDDAGTRSVAGTVSTVDGGKVRTIGDAAFLGYANGAALGGCYPHQQLWNPAGSGKQLVVYRMDVGTSVAGTTLMVVQTQVPLSTQNTVFSKKLGGVIGVGEVRQQNDINVLPAQVMYNLIVQPGAARVFNLVEPIVIPPGWGINVVGTAAASDGPTNFEWFEEPA